jgi:8-amino-7-oxononanoate synthase
MSRMANFLHGIAASHLERLGRSDRIRIIEEPPAGAVDLCSNDYLCLSQDARICDAVRQGIELYGAGSGSSRLVRGHRQVFSDLEAAHAEWVGSDAALFFANGYAANVGTLSAICDPSFSVFVDRLSHASLLDGIRLSGAKKVYFNHNDMGHLQHLLGKSTTPKKVIVTESLFSMDGDRAPLEKLVGIKQKHDAILYVDDAHAIGVLGKNGAGLTAGLPIDIKVATYGKALGLEGAAVATDAAIKTYLWHTARTFVFSTAPMPAICHAALTSIEMAKGMGSDRSALVEASQYLRDGLASSGYACGTADAHIIPVLFPSEREALAAASALATSGIHVKAIRPPTVKESRLRISLNTGVARESLDTVLRVLTDLKQAVVN